MAKFRGFFKRRSIQTKIFLPLFIVTIVITTTIILWASHILKEFVEYRLIDSLHNHQNTVNQEIREIERSLLFYGQFMADIDKFTDQFSNTEIGRVIQVYSINFMRSNGMYPYIPNISVPKESYIELIQKGLMGLTSTSLIEQNIDGKLSLSIDSINPIETQRGIKEVVIISYPLDQKFLKHLKTDTGADISLIYNDQIIMNSFNSPVLQQASLETIKRLPLKSIQGKNKSFLTEWGTGQQSQKVILFPLAINYKNVALFAVSLPLKEVFHIQQKIYTYAGGVAATIMAVIGLLYIFFSYRYPPTRLLSMAAHQLGSSPDGEAGRLQHSFDMMADNVHRMTEDLQRSNKEIAEWNKALEQKVQEQSNRLYEVQQQLHQAEKLSALGQLVSGVAHEINNPLSTIIGFAQMMELDFKDENIKKDVDKIIHEAKRAGKIVKNLLAYARKGGSTKESTQINDIIRETIDLRAYQWRVNNIEVSQNLDPVLSITMADTNQIEQVLLNIFTNAEQAIKKTRRKGKIDITTHQSNRQIFIEISDNGQGISQENQSRIFDPFYTTKEVGQGTGLGLSVTYGIIQEHGGSIKIDSKLGEGSTFIITLPIVEHSNLSTEVSEPENDDRILSGKRMLVIDDEVDVLDFLRRFLESSGCIVETVSNGHDGLSKLRENNYDLIVCDVKMPVMDGKTLYRHICTEMPNMAERVVFSTGDLVGQDTIHFLESTRANFVNKPFDLLALKKVLCEIIMQNNQKQLFL
jgi:signal transduction histidine kinase/CheY-like chemotaxis protein